MIIKIIEIECQFQKEKIKKDLTSFLFFDPLNPYLPNWPNSFLKIGFNAGFRSNELHEGVPVLRIQKLKPKVVLPPIYKIKYNQFSENKNFNYDDDEDLVCTKVAKKLFSKTSNEFYTNKSKNNLNSNRSNGNSQYQKLISIDHNNSENKFESINIDKLKSDLKPENKDKIKNNINNERENIFENKENNDKENNNINSDSLILKDSNNNEEEKC